MTIAIEAEGLMRRFGATWSLDGLDLQVETGAMLGLLGPNGVARPPRCGFWPPCSGQTLSVALPCQRSARNCDVRNLAPPHHASLDSVSDLCGCAGT